MFSFSNPSVKPVVLFFLTLVTSFYQGKTWGQATPPDINFTYITREDGLSHNSVFSIIQDSRGFMWFGTEEGLNRYDSHNFTIYKHDEKRWAAGISNDYINQIIEDRKKQIWVATNYGINLYDHTADRFLPFSVGGSAAERVRKNLIKWIYEDATGDFWLATKQGLGFFSTGNRTFKHYIDNSSAHKFDANDINILFGYSAEEIWIGTSGAGVRKFNIKSKKFSPIKELGAIQNSTVRTIVKDLEGNIWIGTQGEGLWMLDPVNKITRIFRHTSNPASISSNIVDNILCDRKGNLWIGTEGAGLNLLLKGTTAFFRYENDERKPGTLSQKTANYIYQDNQDNIWVAAQRGGLNLYTTNASNFKRFTSGTWPGALSYKDTRAFFEDSEGNILVGTDGGGLNILDKKTSKFKQYRHSPNDETSIGSDAVLNIKQDKKGRIWIGTWRGGLNLFDPKTGKFTRFKHNPNDKKSISSDNVWFIHEDRKGVFWIGTYNGGINIFDPETKSFKRVTSSPDGKTHFSGNIILTIHEDAEGNLWFGTQDSDLQSISADRKVITHYFNNVHALCTDSKGRLWAGRKGLYLFNRRSKTFSMYSTNAYLQKEKIIAIAEDKKGNLWISTKNGLLQFHPQTKYFKRYTTVDGLHGLEFSYNSVLKRRSGELLFGGPSGFNLFNPDSIQTNSRDYPVYLTNFQIFNQDVRVGVPSSGLSEFISAAKKVTLNYHQSVFSFEFAALNYVNPAKTQYAYYLEGFDKHWNYVGSQRKATYTNLNPGRYTFCVKASTDGVWKAASTTIYVIVKPPYWMTWWFRTLAVVITAGAIFIILYYRRKAELDVIYNQKREELQQLQLQFFINISHEFRTPLTLILGTLEQIVKQDIGSAFTRKYHTIHRNANRLMHLISELMDFRKTETGALKLKVQPGNFNLFVEEIAEEFKEESVLNNISFNVFHDKDFADAWFDRQVMEKILLNLINNSFKYTPKGGSIAVSLLSNIDAINTDYEGVVEVLNDYESEQYLYICISDTGVGVSAASMNHLFERYYRVSGHHIGSGIGLAFVKSLTLLHKGNITIYSQTQRGTQVIIAIPCSKNDFTVDELWINNLEEDGMQLESVQFKEVFTQPQREQEQPSVLSRDTREYSILIVEDNEELRTYFKEVLSPYFRVLEAENGQQGIIKTKAESPSLIISDVMMPLMDGVAFCREVRNDLETSHIPFILLTAKDALEFRLEGMESGADYYFSKPVSTELLLLTIRNLFKQREKLKEKYLSNYQVQVRDLVHTEKDKKFINRLLNVIEENLDDPELSVDDICQALGTSKTPLFKKIKDITGQSIVEFIRTVRLKKAMEIMTHEDVLITEVMYRVGILSQSYFARIFKREFGMAPSQFQQQLDRNVKLKK